MVNRQLLVRRLRRAYIQKTCPIRQLHHIVDVRRNANVFVQEFGSFIGGHAGLWAAGKGKRWEQNG